MISAIVAVDLNYGIGYGNELLANIPEDLKRFKEITSGHTVVMGSKTWLSLPKRPLPNRKNIVLSRKKEIIPSEDHIRMTYEEFDEWVKNTDEEVFIIGGAQTYQKYIDKCDRIYLTEILESFNYVDAWFPDFLNLALWDKLEQSEDKTWNDMKYRFLVFERTN